MARDPAAPARLLPFEIHPWHPILVGLALNLGAFVLTTSLPGTPALLRVAMLVLGTAAASWGVALQLRQAKWELFDRVETAAMLGAAGSAMLAGMYAMQEWESGKTFFAALFLVSLLAVALVLLPPLGRRVLLSLVLVFHFTGMLTAVTLVAPPGGTTPWISQTLWAHVYNPYLTFLYMNNAYHFYSPNPSPPSMFWFAVYYDDGSVDWQRYPDRRTSPVNQHYQRMLALPEHSFVQSSYAIPSKERGVWKDIKERRDIGSTLKYPVTVKIGKEEVVKKLPIPLVYGVVENDQYREPTDISKKVLASIAHRILMTSPEKKGAKPVRIRMYRVIHEVLTPSEFARGDDPKESTRYWPFYMGAFDEKGELLDPRDPFLYMYVPIIKVSKDYPTDNANGDRGLPAVLKGTQYPGGYVLDCVEIHAATEVVKQEGDK